MTAISNRGPTGSGLLGNCLCAAVEAFTTGLSRAASAVPSRPSLLRLGPFPADPCCSIPETECPPRCVCTVRWRAKVGEQLKCTIRVTNSALLPRTFALEATEFFGPAGPLDAPERIVVFPMTLDLAPGRSGAVSATFTVPESFEEGDHEAEILVRGAYEQCVRVVLRVLSKKSCRLLLCDQDCFCEVVQGEPPVRIRAHHWYDHFQCTLPCTPVPTTQPLPHE